MRALSTVLPGPVSREQLFELLGNHNFRQRVASGYIRVSTMTLEELDKYVPDLRSPYYFNDDVTVGKVDFFSIMGGMANATLTIKDNLTEQQREIVSSPFDLTTIYFSGDLTHSNTVEKGARGIVGFILTPRTVAAKEPEAYFGQLRGISTAHNNFLQLTHKEQLMAMFISRGIQFSEISYAEMQPNDAKGLSNDATLIVVSSEGPEGTTEPNPNVEGFGATYYFTAEGDLIRVNYWTD